MAEYAGPGRFSRRVAWRQYSGSNTTARAGLAIRREGDLERATGFESATLSLGS